MRTESESVHSGAYSYDELPYPSRAKPETHPAHLAALGILHGLRPAPPQSCRVLELACADGGNLIPMAFRAPTGEFVGVDLGGRQVALGQAAITELGLRNIRLIHRDIMASHDDLGTFDYIIAHGVYSWVTGDVRERILGLCAERLAPGGIAYVSYNVYPGWHLRGLVRQLLLYHAEKTGGDLVERVKESRRFLEQMAQAVQSLSADAHPGADYRAFRLLLEREQETISAQSDWYFAHEFLEDTNEPIYFHQFVSQVGAHGLDYVCEARFPEMGYAHYPAGVVAAIDHVQGDPVAREQYLDFLRLRTFRQSLLCHRGEQIQRTPGPASLALLRVASDAQPLAELPDLYSTAPERFRGPAGIVITVSDPIGKAALLHLGAVFPLALTLDELLDASRSMLSADASALQSVRQRSEARAFLSDLLFKACAAGLAELAGAASEFVTEPGEKPRLSSLARWQAQRSRKVVNMRHEEVELDDDVTLHLARLLDGDHDRLALLHELASMVADGTLVLSRDGQPVEDEDTFMESLEDALSRNLDRLARAALLVA